ncbi:MAG: steroid 5-alpha reductase family enzyme [Verrucomicrobiales bacterium]|jgi:steroid 5-alpha reductase family enzyme
MSSPEKKSAAGIGIAVVLGLIIAWAGGDGAERLGGLSVFALATIAAFAINIAIFIPSFAARTEHYYDLTGSFTYIGVILLASIFSDDLDARAIIVAILVLLWAGRLGTFLFRRVKRAGGDGRFDVIKQSWIRFLAMWVIQGLWVIVTAGAALAAVTSGNKTGFGTLGVLGLAIWIIGFAIEAVSDAQKSAFKSDSSNDGRFINVGLWRWSRHPNYFGEITLWLGMAILAFPALEGWQHLTLISPIFVTVLLTRVSGLPMLERRSDQKWGDQPDYVAYKAATPILIPRPPR